MGLRDLFGSRKEEDNFDPLADLTLSKLRVGYFVDYNLQTWEVTAYNKYDFGEGEITEEWELTSGREVCYLERSEDDEVYWTLNRKIPIGALGKVRQTIIDTDEAPEEIQYKEKTFYLDETGSGYMFPNGQGPSQPFVYWEFVDEDDEQFITVEQWGETDFEAAVGEYVEEYQFSNILPGGDVV